MVQNIMARYIDEFETRVPDDRFPLKTLLSKVLENKIFRTVVEVEDKLYRPAFVTMQAAFELAAAKSMSDEHSPQWQAVFTTPRHLTPLIQYSADKDFLETGISPEILEDPARLGTVTIRGTRSLPAFMSAGGVIISAVQSLKLEPEEEIYFESHVNAPYGANLSVKQIDDLPQDMVGASYFLEGNSKQDITFAFIRAQQADKTGPIELAFGMGNQKKDANIAKEYDRTVKFLDKSLG
ncbi:MAG: hypothetical protein AAF244_00470 [Pseudomonadota bacterium]